VHDPHDTTRRVCPQYTYTLTALYVLSLNRLGHLNPREGSNPALAIQRPRLGAAPRNLESKRGEEAPSHTHIPKALGELVFSRTPKNSTRAQGGFSLSIVQLALRRRRGPALSFVVSRCWLADPRENSVSHWCANRRTLFPDSSKPRNEREQLESRATSFEKIKIEGKNQIQEGQGAKERRESRRLIHKVAQR
jgi:hypothetical protein